MWVPQPPAVKVKPKLASGFEQRLRSSHPRAVSSLSSSSLAFRVSYSELKSVMS